MNDPSFREKHTNKLICAKCGDEMNHHADKLVYPVTAEDVQKFDDILGGRNRRNPLLSGMRGGGVPADGVNSMEFQATTATHKDETKNRKRGQLRTHKA